MSNDGRGKMPHEVMCPMFPSMLNAWCRLSDKKACGKSQTFIACFLCDSSQFASPQPNNLNGIVVATISLVHELLFMVVVQSRIVEPSDRRSPSGYLPDVLTSKE